MEELERFYKAMEHFRKRPGMYVGNVSYEKIVSYIAGYDHCSGNRDGKGILDGFREWVNLEVGCYGNLHWSWIILNMLGGNDEERAIECLFELFDSFYQAVITEGVESIKARAKKMERARWARAREEEEEEDWYEEQTEVADTIWSGEVKLDRIKGLINSYLTGVEIKGKDRMYEDMIQLESVWTLLDRIANIVDDCPEHLNYSSFLSEKGFGGKSAATIFYEQGGERPHLELAELWKEYKLWKSEKLEGKR